MSNLDGDKIYEQKYINPAELPTREKWTKRITDKCGSCPGFSSRMVKGHSRGFCVFDDKLVEEILTCECEEPEMKKKLVLSEQEDDGLLTVRVDNQKRRIEVSEHKVKSMYMYVIMDTVRNRSVDGPHVIAADNINQAFVEAGVKLAEFRPEPERRHLVVEVRPF